VDIIVGEGFLGGFAGAVLKRALGKPFVYDYIDPYTELAGQGPLGVYAFIERKLPQLADLTVCVSYYLKEKAKFFGSKRTELIPNGFDPNWLSLSIKPHKISLEKRKKVLFVGQIGMSRILLESAFYLSPEVLLVILGSGIEEKQIMNFVKTSGLEKRVLFLGYVPHDNVPSLITSSDICVDTSGVETSLKLIEYGVFGKPVIALEGPVTRRFVKDQEIAVSQRNPKDIANTIMRLLHNIADAKNMGENLRKKIINEYRWDVLAEKYTSVLKNLSKKE
ncbi:MAG: glycosyltransferase, partial [Candidatus Bathyarchaeia archaeon]